MADRYWVGGTASWDGTAGTKWATTSGGAGGASVPTSADDVFFTNLSTGTCTISSGNTGAKSINCTGFTGTLAGIFQITVSGGVTFVAGMTLTYSGILSLNGTGTLTSGGKTLSQVSVNGSGITVTLGDALTLSNNITVILGGFDTAGYSVTTPTFATGGTGTKSITLGSSTITVSGNFDLRTKTGLTFNAGTSVISMTGTSAAIYGGPTEGVGETFYNVSFTNTSTGRHDILASNVFNNLTVTAPASAGVRNIYFDSRQTINGTLSTTGTAGNRRVWFRGATYGIAQTLTINSAPSLTDADFRDIYVIGTAAPISGTRVGDLRGCRGITFDTPKTVYWNLAGAQNWSANGWSDTSTGTPNTNFFPLAQDTATFTNAGSVTGTITMNSAVPYTGTVDMSGRTSAMTLSVGATYAIYGDWKNGSGSTVSGGSGITFSGRNTQTITSAGKTIDTPITIDTYGGAVELADALNNANNVMAVTNGTFDTKNFNYTASALSSNNSNVRTIILGSSTVTLSGNPIDFTTTTNLTFNAGTSQITSTRTSAANLFSGGVTFYNFSFTGTTAVTHAINGANTFNNLTLTAPASAGLMGCTFAANQTITGTLTVSGATAVRRIFVRSDTLGTQRTLNVGTLSATDCDFRDIAITGTAAGSSPTRAGDCGGNSGITFPAAKTVYWNLAGAQNWSATAWAPSSGGTPDINNFPLAQDTAVFDEAAGSVTGTITINAAWNIGTFDASLRTSAMTLGWNTGGDVPFYKDYILGSGITHSYTTGTPVFSGRGIQTIITNGANGFVAAGMQVNSPNTTVQLGGAFTTNNLTFSVVTGNFDAVSYNFSVGSFSCLSSSSVIKMGSGTWTLSGPSTVWNFVAGGFYKGTANIVLSSTSTSTRTFNGNSLSYNKLTIGGTTGTSTLTINGNNQFTELASTKTVAHTIALGSTTQTFGKWTVTGTAGNVVTLTGTGTSHILAGACTSGIDYLAMGSIGFAATSPGEFYAGANSTGTAGAPVYRTAKPADSTRYWVGGTGNWSDTNRWSTGSGGAGGASVPRSHDDVVFDSLSNATAYTATVNAVTGGIRMKSLTIAGPASGNVTLGGSADIAGIHGSVTLPATGLTRNYAGVITLSSNSTGLTFTTNGVALASTIRVNGVDCSWSLGSALNMGTFGLNIINGAFNLATYSLTTNTISSNFQNSRTIDFSTGTTTISASPPISFGTTESERANLTVTAGTSQINCSDANPTLFGNNQTFYNVAFTSTSAGTVTLNGSNSFNNLSFTGRAAAGFKNIALTADQTVTGTLTFSAGTDATMRHFCRSDTIGTTRTITAAAVSMTDVDFRDIAIAGAAAPASGTRIGDCKGNSGITFTAAANKYWNLAAGGNWGGAIAWATSSGGTPAINNFPLAQDTCFFEATGLNSGATVTVNQSYNIGTIDMSARTANTMTLATGSQTPFIYGNWINGTGTTLTGTGTITFAGRGSQTITSAGRNFSGTLAIDSPSGSVSIQDALTLPSTNFTVSSGTFSASTYNVTLSSGFFGSSGSGVRTVDVGSGTWSIASTSGWSCATSTNLTVTGTGTISLTSASAKTFAGGGVAYTNITLNQGGNGTLTITGNNTFKTISSTAAGANTINMGTTTQRITTSWTASGTAGNILTVQGTSASSPGTLVFTGGGQAASVDYLTITGVRAYNLDSTWYAGANSTNNGSLGWIFAAPGGTTFNVSFSDTATGSDAAATTLTLNASVSDTATASDTILGGLLYSCDFSDTVTASDSIVGSLIYTRDIFESAAGADALAAIAVFSAAIAETSTGSDAVAVAASTFGALVSELAAGQDTAVALLTAPAAVFESATGADTASAVLVMQGLFSDTVTASDVPAVAASTFNPSFSDTATGADTFIVSASIFTPSFSDTASGSDALAVAASAFNTAFSDTATGADTFSVAASSFVVAFSDTATGADTFAVAASIFTPAFSDTATGSDALSAASIFPVAFSDTATGSDALSAQMVFATAVSELASGLDAFAVAASIFNPSVSELATGQDTPAVAASTFGVSLSDAATLSDAPAASLVLPASFSDTATAADALAAQMIFATAVSELATGTDALSALVIFVSSVSETASVLDTPSVAASIFNVSLSELASGLDAVDAAGSIFNVSFSASGTIADLVVGGYLWNPIDDSQSPNWQNVQNAQAPGWVEVNSTQSPGWQNVVTTQIPNWTDINDSQNPGWVQIQT